MVSQQKNIIDVYMLCRSLDKDASSSSGFDSGFGTILERRAMRRSQNPGRAVREVRELGGTRFAAAMNYRERRDRKIKEQLSGAASID